VIVAKSRGVPVFTDAADAVRDLGAGTLLAFDASSRRLVVNPGEAEQREFAAAIKTRSQERTAALAHADEPASTLDGCRIVVAANVTSVDDALEAARQGAEGSGLVRTEILFGHDSSRPTVEQQTETFLAVAAALGGQPMTIRTWDVGGDKPLRFLPQPMEANPFLGERGLRLFRRQPEVLREQLSAVCLASRETPTKVMFPMVTTAEEVTWALEQLRTAALSTTGDVPSSLEVGIMIEVPAAALRAGHLAATLDFVSIGTNDLTSYTTAAERGNAAVSTLADGLEPAVLQLIGHVCDVVADRVAVAVCGDLASNPAVSALLVGLGVRELSAVAPAVPSVKAAIRRTDLAAARDLATASVAMTSADNVRSLLATNT
jgi:phosphocarrier protein FPr